MVQEADKVQEIGRILNIEVIVGDYARDGFRMDPEEFRQFLLSHNGVISDAHVRFLPVSAIRVNDREEAGIIPG